MSTPLVATNSRVKEARKLGFGKEIVRKALVDARVAEAESLTLSVDARNNPAWNLYLRLGFEAYERREAFLAIGNGGLVRTGFQR